MKFDWSKVDVVPTKDKLEYLFTQWATLDVPEYRHYLDRRVEYVKLLGAANATGTLAVAAFMTTGSKAATLLLMSKIVILIFWSGLIASGIAYYLFYSASLWMELSVIAKHANSGVAEDDFARCIEKIIGINKWILVFSAMAGLLLACGNVVALWGLLVFIN